MAQLKPPSFQMELDYTLDDRPPAGARHEYRGFFLFAGTGGGAMGALDARVAYLGHFGNIKAIGGVDNDAGACREYEKFTGSPITCLDLFSREQYRAWHGKEPPPAWREATPEDVRRAAGEQWPHVVFSSPPCKGASGLLPESSAASAKYQALNGLTIRGIRLTLEAFADNLPWVILLENVPRLKSRGAEFLSLIRKLLRGHGYAVTDSDHDCGQIAVGGLGQKRRRYLLIARHMRRCRPFIYQPKLYPLKTIGDVIGELPMPDDPSLGRLHRLPRLNFITWLRLAMIPPGGDWRDLQKVVPEEYRLLYEPRGGGCYGVQRWGAPGGAVTASASVKGSNACSVADPRVPEKQGRFRAHLRIVSFRETSPAVTGSDHPANGAICVADCRLKEKGAFHGSPGLYGVNAWGKPAPPVAGSMGVSQSNTAAAIADPRLEGAGGRFAGRYCVRSFIKPAGCVTGDADVQCGAQSIADPRLAEKQGRYLNNVRLSSYRAPAPLVTGTRFGSGALAVDDPRLPEVRLTDSEVRAKNSYRVEGYRDTAGTVTGGHGPSSGGISVSDPRLDPASPKFNDTFRVQCTDRPCAAVTGGTGPSAGGLAISDVRLKHLPRDGVYRLIRMTESAGAVTGGKGVGASNGPQAVADDRVSLALSCTPRGNSKGPFGVQRMEEPSSAVFGALDVHSGPGAVADFRMPGNRERLDPPPVIVALDECWHRPLTTFELLRLQDYPKTYRDGSIVDLGGAPDAKCREWIGNAVPPGAARGIFEQILLAFLQNDLGETFLLGQTDIWVRPGERPACAVRQAVTV